MLDEIYGQSCPYVKKIQSRQDIGHMSNEKTCFRRLVPYELNPFFEWSCKSSSGISVISLCCRPICFF